MALDSRTSAALALHRFGLGPRNGSIAAIASDPRGALIAELERPDSGRITSQDLMTSGEAARAAFAFQQARRELAREARKTAKDAPNDGDKPTGQGGAPQRPSVGTAPQDIYLGEA